MQAWRTSRVSYEGNDLVKRGGRERRNAEQLKTGKNSYYMGNYKRKEIYIIYVFFILHFFLEIIREFNWNKEVWQRILIEMHLILKKMIVWERLDFINLQAQIYSTYTHSS